MLVLREKFPKSELYRLTGLHINRLISRCDLGKIIRSFSKPHRLMVLSLRNT